MSAPRIDDRDWSALTSGERIRQIEVEGYLLIPDLLTPEHLARLKAITDSLETTPVDYSIHQRDGVTSSSSAARSPTLSPIPRQSPFCGSSWGRISSCRTTAMPAQSQGTPASASIRMVNLTVRASLAIWVAYRSWSGCCIIWMT